MKQKSYKRIVIICSFCVVFLLAVVFTIILSNMESWKKRTPLGHFTNINMAYAISDTLASQAGTEEKKESPKVTDAIHNETAPKHDVTYGTVNVQEYVNIRTSPSVEGDILGKLYAGDEVVIIGTSVADHEWYQVRAGSLEGFSKAEYFDIRRAVE